MFGVAATTDGGHKVDILVRAADELYRKQQFNDAVTAYQEAANAAMSGGQHDLAFEMSSKAALVLRNQKKFKESSHAWHSLLNDPGLRKRFEISVGVSPVNLNVSSIVRQSRRDPLPDTSVIGIDRA